MPDGPPDPGHEDARGVSRHRSRSPAGSSTGASSAEGALRRVAVAHDLERLDVARLREAAPVARRGAQQLLVEVVADLDLRRVGLDHLDLALEVLVDRDEARRAELDGRRRRLVAEHASGSRGRPRASRVDVAVVLVDVADRVRVDGASAGSPRSTRLIVAIVLPPSLTLVSSRSAWTSRAPISSAARRDSRARSSATPPGLAAGQREDRDAVALRGVPQQDPADADLDVVGMRADRQHDLLALGAPLARDARSARAPSRAAPRARSAWSGSRRRRRAAPPPRGRSCCARTGSAWRSAAAPPWPSA